MDANEVNRRPWIGIRGRQIVVLVVVMALSCYVGFFLLKYTVLDGDRWRMLAGSQQMSTLTIKASRGSIYDSNGTVLAQSSTVWDIIISPKAIYEANDEAKKQYEKDKEKWALSDEDDREPLKPYVELKEVISSGLAKILGADKDKLLKACENINNEYYIVQRKVEKPLTTQINAFLSENNIRADCVIPEESSKRYYPNETLAASIIGFTNFEGDGVYGLEAYYDDYLRGTDGKAVYTRNGIGQASDNGGDFYYSAVDGYSLVLTLDEVLQHYLQKNLEMCISQHSVINRACGIIMNCNTGAVLAMETAPTYDLNAPSTLLSEYDKQRLEELIASGAEEEEIDALEATMREQQWKNKAITELYYPGSVFKTVTCASALEEEVVNLNSTFYCAGVAEVAGTEIHCHNSGHGQLDLQNAVTKSCNPSFIAIGQALGKDKFCDYFEAFGFTEPTGIDLPGESRSLYVSRDNMGPVELASSAFGQTNKVTPIQMATALCAIVNGGYLVTPHLVDKILDSDGNVVETIQPQIKRQVISEETSIQMRGILENVVESNGGTNAYISGYRIGGKSGTTEKIDEYNAAGGKAMGAKMTYVSSFSAFAPADDPQIVMLVMVDTPTGAQYYGSAVAAPVVSAVFKEGLEHLGIYPTYTAEEQAKMDAVVPYVLGYEALRAESALAAQGFDVKIVGDPTSNATVSTQIPYAGVTAPKGSKVVIYLGSDYDMEVGVVPNVIGMTVAQANTAIADAGFNIKISGGAAENIQAVAVMQSYQGGAELYKGNVIEVTFQVDDPDGGGLYVD
ncbi:MAG: PASTA domain-containing protein [Oscillospiraceae bacterium]|nr:PASTA domain-containing protein [Oscillospiraceae bacterium]